MVSLKNTVEEGNGKPPQLFSQEMAVQHRKKVNDVNGLYDSVVETASGKREGKVTRVVIKRKPCIRIVTWNVRSMLRREMTRREAGDDKM